MKKFFSFIISMIITLSILLTSYTEEEVKISPTDGSGKGEHGGL